MEIETGDLANLINSNQGGRSPSLISQSARDLISDKMKELEKKQYDITKKVNIFVNTIYLNDNK
jgi:hypothetical protein